MEVAVKILIEKEFHVERIKEHKGGLFSRKATGASRAPLASPNAGMPPHIANMDRLSGGEEGKQLDWLSTAAHDTHKDIFRCLSSLHLQHSIMKVRYRRKPIKYSSISFEEVVMDSASLVLLKYYSVLHWAEGW
ncbi:hypothetical protein MKW98_009128 [Papaver atlanticum]|uniref:Uncharacterized protein n=1 Tax=Papaver atlanticum TaxID=357466 RepID=A0AAD4XRV9_9MAGN|nr:hypothetical protein MKW98_009128 [Papaver atlanticum]